jgi:DNA-binding transcriptional LysR family regulator
MSTKNQRLATVVAGELSLVSTGVTELLPLSDVFPPFHDSRLQFDDLQAIADAAVAGVGLACLPCWMMAPHIRSGELQWVLCGERLLAAEIHAVWPQTRHLPSKTRAAIDALVQQVPAVLEAARDFRTRR